MNGYVLVIDRGSTNVKAVLFDRQLKEIACKSCFNIPPVSKGSGFWEQDMDAIWEVTTSAVKSLLDDGYAADSIEGVIVTGQGNGLMALDKNKRPARMGILSLDSRASDIYNGWKMDGRYMQAAQVVGMPFPVGSPLPLLAWFKENSPEEFDRIDKVLFSKDWIRFKLSGSIVTDQTDASGAGLMALAKGEYAWDVFNLLGLSDIKEKLPPIKPSHEIVGQITAESAEQTGLKVGTPVLCGVHDIASFPFGVGTLDPEELVAVIGTWGMNLSSTQNLEGALAALYHCVPEYFITGLGDGNSGGCLDVIINMLCAEEKAEAAQTGKSVYRIVEDKIAAAHPNGIIFHPYIFGSLLNSKACAGFYGIKNWHTKADMLRAVFEGIIMGHFAYIQVIAGHENFKSVWLIGGGAKSDIFGQMFADISGLPVKTAVSNEITARGAAMNAFVGISVFKDHQEACIPAEIKRTFKPNPKSQEYYSKKFGEFCRLSQVNTDVWNNLDEINRQQE